MFPKFHISLLSSYGLVVCDKHEYTAMGNTQKKSEQVEQVNRPRGTEWASSRDWADSQLSLQANMDK